MKIHGTFSVLAGLALAGIASADVITVPNGGFESGTATSVSNWTGVVSGDATPGGTVGVAQYGAGVVTSPTSAVVEGSSALKIWAGQGGNSNIRYTLTSDFSSAIAGNQTYRFALTFYKQVITNGHLYVNIDWYDANSNLISSSRFSDNETEITSGRTYFSANSSSNGDFSNAVSVVGPVHSDLTAPADAVKFKITIVVGGWVYDNSDAYFIDNITVSTIPEPASLGGLVIGGAVLLLARRK